MSPALCQLGQRLSLQVLHDQVLDTVLIAHVVERTDVGMRELGDRLGLPLEALPEFRGRGEMFRQDLDRHRSLEPRVPSLVNLAHASRPDGRKNLIRAESRTGVQSHATPYFLIAAVQFCRRVIGGDCSTPEDMIRNRSPLGATS